MPSTKYDKVKQDKIIKMSQYEHGGSRIYFESDKDSGRDLLVDTYQDKRFAEYILECVKQYDKVKDGRA